MSSCFCTVNIFLIVLCVRFLEKIVVIPIILTRAHMYKHWLSKKLRINLCYVF